MDDQKLVQKERGMIVRRLTQEPEEYSPQIILGTLEDLGSSKEQAIREIASTNSGREAVKKIFSDVYKIGKSIGRATIAIIRHTPKALPLFLPFTLGKNLSNRINDNDAYFISSIVGVSEAAIIGVSTNYDTRALVGYLGLLAANGIYELWKSNKNKIREMKQSGLERITD